jgi:hypothetical protein
VGLCISGAHLGLREALLECFPQADGQRLTVHFYRNILSFCPRRLREDLAASLKTTCDQESADEARAKALRVASKWRSLLPEACSVLEEGLEDTLTFYSYPRSHWRHIRCSFLALLLMHEIKARTGGEFEWNQMRQDLEALYEIEVEQDGKTWLLRSPLQGCAGKIFKACGVVVPPSAREAYPNATALSRG